MSEVNTGVCRVRLQATAPAPQRLTHNTVLLPDAHDGPAAVVIFAIIKSPGQPNRVVIVKQFRPPLDTYTVELCAGLVDEGETVEVRSV